MKHGSKLVLTALAVGLIVQVAFAITASDDASDPAYTGQSTFDGLNGGTGFTAWTFVGAGQFSGGFFGNSTQGGRESINSPNDLAFALFANGMDMPFVDARRQFSGGAMEVGDVFTFDMNFRFNGGDRGFSLYAGDFNTEIFNINHGGSDALFIGGQQAFDNVFNLAVNFTLSIVSPTELRADATATGLTPFSQTFTISALPDRFKFYFSNPSGTMGDDYAPFFNNLAVVPEPSTLALVGVSLLTGLGVRRRKRA